jgi:hypothetical protein
MSNIVSQPANNLPVAAGVSSLAASVLGGMSGEGRAFPEISVKGARWRLRPLDGDEQVLNTFNIQFALVTANPAKSKTFYLTKYDPDGEPRAPDCFSDDGVRPDDSAQSKQSDSCATCPHNVWGSDINPVSGKKNKRCKDSKRIAVALMGDPDAQIFAWRLSPMNMMAFADAIKDAVRQNIDIDRVAFDATFDAKSDYPKVIFTVKRPLTNDEVQSVTALRQSPAASAAVGIGRVVTAPVHVVEQAAKPEVVEQVAKVEVVEQGAPAKVTQIAKPKASGSSASVDLDALLDL